MGRAFRDREGDAMNKTIMDALAAEVSTLGLEVTPPSGDLGYGTDLSCTTDLAFDFSEVDARSRAAIVEQLVRMYITARGSLIDDASWGMDVRLYLNHAMTPRDIIDLQTAMAAQAKRDDRISDAVVTLTYTEGVMRMRGTVILNPVDPSLGPFEAVLAITSAEVALETIRVL
jgi:hypothetical protein